MESTRQCERVRFFLVKAEKVNRKICMVLGKTIAGMLAADVGAYVFEGTAPRTVRCLANHLTHLAAAMRAASDEEQRVQSGVEVLAAQMYDALEPATLQMLPDMLQQTNCNEQLQYDWPGMQL